MVTPSEITAFLSVCTKNCSHITRTCTPEYKAITEIGNRNIKLIDATTMSVCLKLFNWAKFRTAKGCIKVHVSLDEATMIL